MALSLRVYAPIEFMRAIPTPHFVVYSYSHTVRTHIHLSMDVHAWICEAHLRAMHAMHVLLFRVELLP